VKEGKMSRTPMIAGNWKMNKTTAEATTLAQNISYCYQKDYSGVDIVLCPPFTDLRSVRVVLGFDESPIELGAQNVYWEKSGAYTGEISPEMLKELGCGYCIVGHSERRQLFQETDEQINLKVKALLAYGIAPIICCGETLEMREAGSTIKFVTSQVIAALDGVDPSLAKQVVIAYEPIWAIGTGLTATPDQAQEVSAAIRATICELYGNSLAAGTRILYGGSMKPANASLFAPMPDIDGGLIGGAALVAEEFNQLVKAFL
jgi:triosephosphate isomerase